MNHTCDGLGMSIFSLGRLLGAKSYKILAAVSYREKRVRELENVCGNDYLIKQRGAFPLRDANVLYDFLQSGQKIQYKQKDPDMQLNF